MRGLFLTQFKWVGVGFQDHAPKLACQQTQSSLEWHYPAPNTQWLLDQQKLKKIQDLEGQLLQGGKGMLGWVT